MYTEQRSSSRARLKEVRELLSLIRQLEPQDVKVHDPSELLILRGLFFVHLYSVIEFTVTTGVARTLAIISEQNILHNQLKPPFLALAADNIFSQIKSSNYLKQIEHRLDLLDGKYLSEPCAIREEVLGKYLQNIYPETIETIFSILCIQQSIVPEERIKGYLHEVTNNRNSVAHGRESTVFIGSRRRHLELVKIFDAVSAFLDYFYDCLEECIDMQTYVRAV